MNIYAQLLDDSKIGTKVGITYQNGNAVVSRTIDHGKFGVIKSVNNGVAFVEILKDIGPKTLTDIGTSMGIAIDLPVSATGYLSITVEDD